MIARVEEIFPKSGDGFALRDRVCADKGGARSRTFHEVGGFLVPSGNVVEIFNFGEDFLHIGFLRGRLISKTDERRIADNVIRNEE